MSAMPANFTDRTRTAALALIRHVVAEDHSAATTPGEIAPGQVHERDHAIPVTEQGDQVQPKPGKPGDRAAQLQPAAQLHDSRPAADGRHGAFVVILERSCRLSGNAPDDLL